jgi:hypothetical protein
LCLRRGANINHQNVRLCARQPAPHPTPLTPSFSLPASALAPGLTPSHTLRVVCLCPVVRALFGRQLNGQTVLHYAFAYGFEELARYLMDKGADDSLKNGSGLTCYEGLTAEDVENI